MIVDVEVVGINKTDKKYFITVEEEIRRVLLTRKGAVPHNEVYGSNLY